MFIIFNLFCISPLVFYCLSSILQPGMSGGQEDMWCFTSPQQLGETWQTPVTSPFICSSESIFHTEKAYHPKCPPTTFSASMLWEVKAPTSLVCLSVTTPVASPGSTDMAWWPIMTLWRNAIFALSIDMPKLWKH